MIHDAAHHDPHSALCTIPLDWEDSVRVWPPGDCPVCEWFRAHRWARGGTGLPKPTLDEFRAAVPWVAIPDDL